MIVDIGGIDVHYCLNFIVMIIYMLEVSIVFLLFFLCIFELF